MSDALDWKAVTIAASARVHQPDDSRSRGSEYQWPTRTPVSGGRFPARRVVAGTQIGGAAGAFAAGGRRGTLWLRRAVPSTLDMPACPMPQITADQDAPLWQGPRPWRTRQGCGSSTLSGSPGWRRNPSGAWPVVSHSCSRRRRGGSPNASGAPASGELCGQAGGAVASAIRTPDTSCPGTLGVRSRPARSAHVPGHSSSPVGNPAACTWATSFSAEGTSSKDSSATPRHDRGWR